MVVMGERKESRSRRGRVAGSQARMSVTISEREKGLRMALQRQCPAKTGAAAGEKSGAKAPLSWEDAREKNGMTRSKMDDFC